MSADTRYISGLWNAVENILAFWANELVESLEQNEPPDDLFWARLAADLEAVDALVQRARRV